MAGVVQCPVSSTVGRDRLRRLWANPLGRRLSRLLEQAGLDVAVMVRYEAAPTEATDTEVTSDGGPVPAGFALERWRADDPAISEAVPGEREAADVVVGATIDGDLVGYCVVSPRPVRVEEIGGVVEPRGVSLWDLYVHPAFRGRGLGTALLRRARATEAATEAGTIEALVAAANEPSRRAFAAAGFVPTERVASVGWRDRRFRRTRPLGGLRGERSRAE